MKDKWLTKDEVRKLCSQPRCDDSPRGAVGYEALVAKLDEYIKFLGEDSRFIAMRGGCSEERFDKGVLLRSQIDALREAL